MNRHGDRFAPSVLGRANPGGTEISAPESPAIGILPATETEAVLFAMSRILEQRDHHTAGHSERLAYSAVALGAAMRLDSQSLLSLYVGGYLHDIGKVGIPDSILFKPGKLDDDEWAVMRDHPVRGEEICRPLTSLGRILPIIRNHHERWDGSGYPDGLRGQKIPLLARIVQVVDIYDALTHPRPYKVAFAGEHALELLQEECNRGWRDREITGLFIRMQRCNLSESAAKGVEGAPANVVNSLRNLQAQLTL